VVLTSQAIEKALSQELKDMRITWTGKIIDGFYALGHASVPMYLLDGPAPALFDAGFTGLAQVYEQEIRRVLGSRPPAYLFLTHTHWDHVGSAAYLKTVWPQMQVMGSARASNILTQQKAIKKIKALNQEAVGVLRNWGVKQVYEGRFKPFNFDHVLKPKQSIELGNGLSVQAIPAPGHTWDFLTYWMPEKRILIASEAVACDDIPEFLVDYDVYQGSLKALSQLDVEVLCTGHQLIFTGLDARKHIQWSLNQAADYVAMVERLLREEDGEVERVVARIKAEKWDPKPLPKQPERAYVMNTEIRVNIILERMKKRK
jgi:glyoxylase-like metal-dependent hydrolase (beta-lactamase superfamily II)